MPVKIKILKCVSMFCHSTISQEYLKPSRLPPIYTVFPLPKGLDTNVSVFL